MKRLLVFVTLCAAFPLDAHAQSPAVPIVSGKTTVPRVIKYSGVLSDPADAARIGSIAVTFAIYGEPTGGAPLWHETHNVQLDAQGRYTVLLGSVNQVPADIFSANAARWLGVQVLGDAEAEQTRVMLLSVPYALKAQDAETLGGLPVSAFILKEASNDDEVVAGTRAKRSALSGAAAKSLDAGIVNATGGGTIDSIPKFGATDTLTDSIITEKLVSSELRIGIGMGLSNPVSKLQINGRMTAEGFDIITSAEDSVHITNSHALGSAIEANASSTSGGQTTAVYASTESSNGTGIFAVALAAPSAPGDTSFGVIGYTWNPGAAILGLSVANDVGAFGGFPTFPERTGIYAGVNSSTAQPLVVQNRHASGTRLISARNSAGTEVIGMTTGGNITATGTVAATSFSGSGAGLTGVTAASATMAAALASDPPACVANRFVTDIAATGALTCAQPSTANLSDGSTLATKTYADTETTRAQAAEAKLAVRGINYIAGCDSCNLLQTTDSEKTIYMNVVGPMTINQVTCISDLGSPTINLQRDDGSATNLLSSDLACTAAGATSTGFVSGEAALGLNDKLDFYVTGGTGSAHRVTVVIKATVN
ncbi:MAG TPA: hypothetical protein VMZ25_11575 [Terriglobales bacterium]|nr:hypothetical protein [Terriglobales bacterium]